MVSLFAFPTKIHFGDGALESLREVLAQLGSRKPLIVTDAGIREEQIGPMALKALEDECHLVNPRPCALSDMVSLYRQAL